MKDQKLQLSNQALGAIMMALQESLLNELDIVPILRGFDLASLALRLTHSGGLRPPEPPGSALRAKSCFRTKSSDPPNNWLQFRATDLSRR